MNILTASDRPPMFHRPCLTLLAPLLLAACGGGGGATSTSDAAPRSDTPGAQSVVTASDDPTCIASMKAARTLYGAPDAHETVRAAMLGSIDIDILAWPAIETVVSFARGADIVGCEATYAEGGPAIGVPAIEPPPASEPAPAPAPAPMPTPAPAPAPSADPEFALVQDDPLCTASLEVVLEDLGAPSEQRFLFASEAPSGLTTIALLYRTPDAVLVTLEQMPTLGMCLVTFASIE